MRKRGREGLIQYSHGGISFETPPHFIDRSVSTHTLVTISGVCWLELKRTQTESTMPKTDYLVPEQVCYERMHMFDHCLHTAEHYT